MANLHHLISPSLSGTYIVNSVVDRLIHYGGNTMFSWALTFLIVALIAGLFGLSGVAGVATQIAWALFVIGLILSVIFFVAGRRPPV